MPVLQQYWGYSEFRPLQKEAMESVMARQDSLVVLPTGGGKSLCYQVPALAREGMMVVVSPLIALMKDQVDALIDNGISAAAVNSTLSVNERRKIAQQIEAGEIKLLYVAPERLCTGKMIDFLSKQKLSAIAVDEAHCISTWGHNFRPEYRLLGDLRNKLPDVDMHAYTATATEQVRHDICEQLQLKAPAVLTGNFDRPNLIYRIQRRQNLQTQVRQVIEKYPDSAGIIYCISRRQVDELSTALKEAGYRALAYHAGLENGERHRAQEAFLKEEVDIIVATVAFGMGIDKSNVRYVIHASATKSLENYQQETGRAGRDGLHSECVLFYSGNDFATWKRMLSDLSGEAALAAEEQLKIKSRYCSSLTCRHRALVEHFGQQYEKKNCGACDVCLGEVELMPDSLVIAQKILSCVVRVDQRFGADYVANVLIGSRDQRIFDNAHHELTTYNLLKGFTKSTIRGWIDQLIDQECLIRDEEHQTLKLTPRAKQVFHSEYEPRLLQATKKASTTRPEKPELQPDDQFLFEELRAERREIASEKGIAPFIVFSDVSLIDMAQKRPQTEAEFLNIHGVGQTKADQYATRFIERIKTYCENEAESKS
ncbi:DNA helicase RecQ [Rubinisphaera sp.]|uniref:DNA helicase RecQ n=1 Tax=Rubinisphaera sp. TaxID=2024857 RepID=UPI0025FFEA72|nr:DNA helicase RecQ [Rubinisphaera sp.]